MHRFSLCLLQQQQKGQGGKKKKKGLHLAGELDILPTWFRTIPPSLISVTERKTIMKQGSLPTQQGQGPLPGTSSTTAGLTPPPWAKRFPS